MITIDFNPADPGTPREEPPARPAPVTIAGFTPAGAAPWTLTTAPAATPTTGDCTGYRTLPFVSTLRACSACSCRAEAKQVVPGIGPVDARILVLGQNPGEEEDARGEPFLGAGGEELNVWLGILGLRRDRLASTCPEPMAANAPCIPIVPM